MSEASSSTAHRPARPPLRHLERKREAVESFLRFESGGERPRYPLEIFLEVSNVCDLHCVMCPPFSAFNPERARQVWFWSPGFLEVEAATAALEPLLEHALTVHAFGYGEPTIHPNFRAFLRHLSGYEVLIDFITNGMHLTEELVELVVELSVFEITVSLSGSTAELYENVYQGGDFARVLSGLARLRDARRAAGSAFPRVRINSLSFDHHVRELDRFVDLMAEHGVNCVGLTRLLEHAGMIPQLEGHAADFRTPEIREAVERARAAAAARGIELAIHPTIEEEMARASLPANPGAAGEAPLPILSFKETARGLPVLPGVKVKSRKDSIDLEHDAPGEIRRRLVVEKPPGHGGDRPFYCMEPFKTFYLRRGGTVKTCCYMANDAPALGDTARWSGERIWTGSAYETVRDGILNGQYPMAACGSCLENRQAPQAHGVGGMIRDYLEWSRAEARPPMDLDQAALLDASTNADLVDRQFAEGGDRVGPPDAAARARRVIALLDEDRSWSAALEGCVDHVSERGVAGWIRCTLFPELRLPLSVWIGGRRVADLAAREFRPDLFRLGKGDGRYGFTLLRALSPEEVRVLEVRLGESSFALERIAALREG